MKELTDAFRDIGYPTLEAFQQEFCTNNYFEMLGVVKNELEGEIVPMYQDLFLEQRMYGVPYIHI